MSTGSVRAAAAALIRFAARDLRTILFSYKVLVLSVAIGVAAVTGVSALTDSFLRGLERDGRALAGGDVSLSRAQEPPTPAERAFLESRGRFSLVASARAMVKKDGGDTALADIKAVDANYPLVGTISTTPAISPAQLDTESGERGALLDPALLARLGMKVGDTLHIGSISVVVRAVIDAEPDRLVAGASFAPRLILSRDALAATGLVTPEALVRWTGKLALPDRDGKLASDAQVAATVADFKAAFPQNGFEIRTRSNASPQIERIVDRIARFLVVMGLLSIVVGGIGVWNAVTLFVERQRISAAIFKTLGASGAFVFGLALTEILTMAALGIVLGLLFGSLLPFAFQPALVGAGVGNFQAIVSPRALAGGAAVGFGAALVFSIIPAGASHDVPGALLLRGGESAGSFRRLRLRYAIMAAASLVLFIAAIGAVAGDLRFAAAVVIGALVLATFFNGAARVFARAVRALPKPASPIGALAWTGLSRSSAMARAVIISLGVGLIVLAATSAVTASLRAQLLEGLPDATPNLFLVGLPAKDDAEFRSFLARSLPGATIDEAPLMRGRIVEVGGVPAEKVAAKDGAAWVLEGDRGITFTRTPRRDSTLVSGQWWPTDYDGPPLVSLGADAARGLGLHVGDTVAVNIGGRVVSATIANLREINWASFGINFVLVFSPRPVEGAPHTILFTVAARALDDATRNAAFIRDLSAQAPSVIAIDVHSMLAQAKILVDKVGLAIEASAIFTILAAAVVLAGAVAADSRARGRTTTILKILGGTRRQLVMAALLEFVVLGLATGLLAVGAGNLVAWGVLRFVIDTPFVLALWPLVVLLGATVTAIALFGLVGNWRVLAQPPGRVLRQL